MNSVHKTNQSIRAAAILTTAAVASSVVNIPQTVNGKVLVYVDFTLGSLTNVIITPQVNDGSGTWRDVTDPGALTLTASGAKAIPVDCSGAKQFRCTAQGTGTVTSSSLTLQVGYMVAGGVNL